MLPFNRKKLFPFSKYDDKALRVSENIVQKDLTVKEGRDESPFWPIKPLSSILQTLLV